VEYQTDPESFFIELRQQAALKTALQMLWLRFLFVPLLKKPAIDLKYNA
jgi:hypothetical protein